MPELRITLATQHADAYFAPLALLYLKAALVAGGTCGDDEVAILEFADATSAEAIAGRILEREPDVLGLSCYVWNITTLTTVCRLVKARRPQTRIVLGGPEVGPVAAAVLHANPAADVVVRSEGERPLPALISEWMRHGDLAAVAGITYRNGGAVVETADAPILTHLDELASPHLTLDTDLTGRSVCIETQRGCVFRCNFCFYNKDLSIRNRRFDLDRVKEEIAHWLRQDIRELYLMDPIFNLNAARAKEICRFIAAHNERRVGVHAEVWAEFIDDDMARLMREAGFTFLEVGLQSTADEALATVERRLKLQRFLDGIAALKRHELRWELQLIAGLPGETRASFRQSLDFAATLEPPVLAVYPLMVLPGTELWRKADELRLSYDPCPPYHVRSHYSMSEDDVAYGFRVVRALQDIGEARAVTQLARQERLPYADLIDAWIAWDDAHPGDESIGYRTKHFLLEFCAGRQMPSDHCLQLLSAQAG
ncbi:MAG TPA: radical SAM protein [Vicinamibacterales bacterium]|nr:radical SAM protein [Vicinamibacterales bacterium]